MLNNIGKVVVLYIYVKSDYLKGQNFFCKEWVRVELLAFVAEIPYFLFVQY